MAPEQMFRVKHDPNFQNLRRALLRQGPPGPVPFIELFADPGMVQAVLGEDVTWNAFVRAAQGAETAPEDGGAVGRAVLDLVLRFCYEMGFDYVYAWTGLNFPRTNFRVSGDTAALGNWIGGLRIWQDETTGPIQDWADFEAYPWQRPQDISYRAVEYLSSVVPEGMKVSVVLGGIFENASWLMGLESFSYALADQPDLVAAICEKVGELTLAAAAHVVSVDNVGMVFLGDDLGYANGTLVSPAVLRKYIFPYHRRLVEIAHGAGRLALLHSCGNLASVMDEIIAAGFDGKHSFEDKIMPVEEVYRRWGDRIAVLGGLDMDLLARGSQDAIRERTRQVLEACGRRGTGYCLGSGNSAANYIPAANYLAMLDEGRRWNDEHYGAA